MLLEGVEIKLLIFLLNCFIVCEKRIAIKTKQTVFKEKVFVYICLNLLTIVVDIHTKSFGWV